MTTALSPLDSYRIRRSADEQGLELDEADIGAIGEQCRRRLDVLWEYADPGHSNGNRHMKIRYAGAQIIVLYDETVDTVVAVLPPMTSDEGNGHFR